MNSLRKITIETYDKSAPELAVYFKGIGPRTEDIDHVFALLGDRPNPTIVEIGCGDGRDAEEIIKRTSNYTGFDISQGMIDIARAKLPTAQFEVADAARFNFPPEMDAVIAFASLLHLDKDEVGSLFKHVAQSLKSGGIFYISTKYAPHYTMDIKRDQFGERLFHFYSEEMLAQLAGNDYEVASDRRKTVGGTTWVELALRKL